MLECRYPKAHPRIPTVTRPQVVSDFAEKLEGIEQSRLKDVGEQTKKLVDTLVAIAHQSPNDVERCVSLLRGVR